MTGGMYPGRWWVGRVVWETSYRHRTSCAKALHWEEPGTLRRRKEAKET